MIHLLPQRRWLWWLVLLLGGAMVIVVLILLEQPPRAELLTSPSTARPSRLAFLGRWSGPLRPMLQRLKWRLLGPPRSVSLEARIFECDGSFEAASLSLPPGVLSNRTGVQLWLLGTNEAWAVGKALVSTSGGAVWTRDGMAARLSLGRPTTIAGMTRIIGLEMDLLPRSRGGSVDLACFFTSTTAVTNELADPAAANRVFLRTNAAVGARVLIPVEQSLFVLDKTGANGKRLAVIISPLIYQPPK